MDFLLKSVEDYIRFQISALPYKVPTEISLPISVQKCTIAEDFCTIICWNMVDDDAIYLRSEKEVNTCYRFYNKQNGPLHTHDYIEFAYIISGNFRQVVEGVEISLSEGDCCFADMRSPHYDIIKGSKCSVIFFCMSVDFVSQIVRRMNSLVQLKAYIYSLTIPTSTSRFLILHPNSDEATNSAAELVNSLMKEAVGKVGVGREFILRGLTLRLFEIFETGYHFKAAQDPDARELLIYSAVEQYIRNNISIVTSKDLEKEFHFNVNYFNLLIQKITGYTYKQFVQKQRIDLAIELLLSTNKTVREISEIVGYENRTFFYKLFVENTGLSPAEFRKQKRNEEGVLQ